MKQELIKLFQGYWKYIALVVIVLSSIGICKIYEQDELSEEKSDYIINIDDELLACKTYLESSSKQEDTSYIRAEIEALTIAKEYELTYDGSYEGDAISEAIDLFELKYKGKKDDKVVEAEKLANELLMDAKEKNYEKFIFDHKRAVDFSEKYTETEKNLEQMRSNFMYKINPLGETNNFYSSLVSYYYGLIDSLQNNVDHLCLKNYDNVLKENEKEEYERRVKILEYSAEKGYIKSRKKVFSANTRLSNMYNAANMVAIVFIFFLTAMCFGGEIDTGTIKNLLISPKSRFCIMLEKYFSLVIISLLLHAMISVIVSIIGYIMFGDELLPYMYILNGQVKEINIYLSFFGGQLLQWGEVFMWISVMATVSLLLKNKGVSTVIICLWYFGNTVVYKQLQEHIGNFRYLFPAFFGDVAKRFFDKQYLEADYLIQPYPVELECPVWLSAILICSIAAMTAFLSCRVFKKRDF